jgi:hypothetical protein
MKRFSTALLLSAVTLAGSLTAAHGQATAGRSPYGYVNNWPPAYGGAPAGTSSPAAGQRLVPVAAPAPAEAPVDLPAMEARTIVIPGTADRTDAALAGPSVQVVNSRNLIIDFELKGLGPSGVGEVELWYTRNGQSWRKFSGATQMQSPFTVDVTEDGLYGFVVVASNGMGLGKTPPKPGDVPQVWVDVDTTKPEVHLLGTQAGVEGNARTLTLRWSATDRNLVAKPITLSYSENAQGPWIPFATNLDNTGFYTWHMSSGLPAQVLVKVEATDRIGNIGEDQSTMPTPLDLTKPTVTIKNVSRNGTIQQTEGH